MDLRKEDGVALIVVILIMSIIVAVTLEFNRASRMQIYESANARDGIKLEYIAKSGIYIGRSALKEDDAAVDSFLEDWAKARELSAQSAALFDGGFFELTITDESGKIPVNHLVKDNHENEKIRELFIRFLLLPEFGLSEEEANDLADAVKDWIDGDDEITGFGAENSYYQGLENPYPCKNAPMDRIEELLMVKGVTRELFYGTDERRGIASYLTVYGKGRININTAPLPILKALSGEITGEMVAEMDEYRKSEDNDLSNPSWYTSVPGMAGIVIDSDLISAASSIFEIKSTGRTGNMMRTITAVVTRESGDTLPVIISWNVG
ncbi:MAG: type II secretion system minor pseudopilin GspK [Syntrophales bacterium]|jgi:general secretion pathway protein K|nr:type II secretion system minor pseudopilin GspK [Syntrophales bacterium]MDY0044340.1 type II secretion system minor pseudopilin GspK [Syntrophales bacterium]